MLSHPSEARTDEEKKELDAKAQKVLERKKSCKEMWVFFPSFLKHVPFSEVSGSGGNVYDEDEDEDEDEDDDEADGGGVFAHHHGGGPG